MQRQFFILGITGLILLTSCSTSLHTSWNDPYYKAKKFKNIIILELSENPEQRKIFETSTAAFFNKKGINAIPSYTKMKSDTSFKYYQFEMKFDSLDIDAILVFRMMGTKETETFVPDPGMVFPQYYFNYYTYYLNNYNMIHSPGYFRKDLIVKMETNLYSNRVICWFGQPNHLLSIRRTLRNLQSHLPEKYSVN